MMRFDLLRIALKSRVVPLTLLFCSIPYFGLRLYLRQSLHAIAPFASEPDPVMLVAIAMLGGLLPAIGLAFVLRTLIRDRSCFRLGMLLEVYVSLILIFATGYAILQAAGQEPAFSGMPVLWGAFEGASLGDHVRKLHEVFLNALYLSVITMTTVGFGDVVPLTPWAKLVSALQGMMGIGFTGVALGHYFSVRLQCR